MNMGAAVGLGVLLGISILVSATLFTKVPRFEYAPECMKDFNYNSPECRALR